MDADSTATPARAATLWINAFALLCAGAAVWLLILGLSSSNERESIWLGLLAALCAWGVGRRRRWGYTMAVTSCWLVIVLPIVVNVLAVIYQTWVHPGDNIGPGVVLVFSTATWIIGAPIALVLLTILKRPCLRHSFSADQGLRFDVNSLFVGILVISLLLMATLEFIY